MTHQADIVIPVYRDAKVTERCVEAALETAGKSVGQIILVDDCSPEPEMASTLARLQTRHPQIIVLRQRTNQGFVRSVNLGLELRQRDVVLLNSDTLPAGDWLAELLDVAYLDDRIACVSPLTNNGAFCSVPDFWGRARAEAVNEKAFSLAGLPRVTETPSAVGFCLLLKQRVLDLLGPLDPLYGRGYSEENDWVLRARAAGFRAVRANHALVLHLGSVSFGAERTVLHEKNRLVLNRRFPAFEPEMRAFCSGAVGRVASHSVEEQLHGLAVVVAPSSTRPAPGLISEGSLVQALRARGDVRVAAELGLEEDVFQLRQSFELPRTASELEQLFTPPVHAMLAFSSAYRLSSPDSFETAEQYLEARDVGATALQCAQGVLVMSEYRRAQLLADHPEIDRRVHVVPPALNHAALSSREAGASAEALHALGVTEPFFLWVGDDSVHHALRVLLAAYAELRRRLGPTAPELVLVGRAQGGAGGFFHLPEAEWAPPGVRFLQEAMAMSSLPALYHRAICMVMLSDDEDAELPALQALAAGCPLIHGGGPALTQWMGTAALNLASPDVRSLVVSWERLAADEALQNKLRHAGPARVASLTVSNRVDRLVAVWRRIVRHPDAASLAARQRTLGLLRAARRSR